MYLQLSQSGRSKQVTVSPDGNCGHINWAFDFYGSNGSACASRLMLSLVKCRNSPAIITFSCTPASPLNQQINSREATKNGKWHTGVKQLTQNETGQHNQRQLRSPPTNFPPENDSQTQFEFKRRKASSQHPISKRKMEYVTFKKIIIPVRRKHPTFSLFAETYCSYPPSQSD